MPNPKLSHETIKLKWVKPNEQWHMTTKEGKFLNEFYDCENINWFFPSLDKEKENIYEVTIRKVE